VVEDIKVGSSEQRFSMFVSESFDPYCNLAYENFLAQNLKTGESCLFFWTNESSIFMGKFQNPWAECGVTSFVEEGGKLLRRPTGGGCVYHDKGCLNFSFLHSERDFRKDFNNSIILEGLKSLGINASANPRGDLVHSGKKFSGNAFRRAKNYSIHHGTLLINTDLNKLNATLCTQLGPITTKALPSIRSKVLNLSELVHGLKVEDVVNSIWKALKDFRLVNESLVLVKPELILAKNQLLMDLHQKFCSWDWIYGQTPKFNYQVGGHKVFVEKGLVSQFELMESLAEECLIKGDLARYLGMPFDSFINETSDFRSSSNHLDPKHLPDQ
jgi:lipoate---protein ligase